jgi:type IV pilus assembly protein PilX
MLTPSTRARRGMRSSQSGVTLLITLIVLVAMTLATIALVRSVDTTNIIAGNLAFQQAALHAADAGTEEAARTLLPNVATNHQLNCNGNCPLGYISWHDPTNEPPAAGKTWDDYWTAIHNNACNVTNSPGTSNLCTPVPTDAYGNSVSYIVESMCDGVGQSGQCAQSPPSMSGGCSGSDLGASGQQCIATIRRYFRVTTRVQGPRNTVSYVQAMLAM